VISEPAAAHVFVGREAVLASISETFARGARSILLSGPPGVGKTRLAARLVDLDAAAMHAGLVVDLARTRTDEALVAGLAAALDLRADAGPPPDLARVAAAWGAWSPRIVVLDNAEGLDESARALLATLLARLPRGARVVATSRERAAVRADASIEVAGLGTEAGGEAALLFAERARALGASLDRDDAAVVLEVVRALDGNPLAIELAAAQLDVLSPVEIQARLARRLDLAADDRGGARFPTLRAAIAASWEGLDEGARRVLAGASIFAGELTADAAEAILGDASVDVVAALRRLRDRSLVAGRRSEPKQGTGKNRLRLDASVRLFAREHLDASGERSGIARRHATWFVGRAETMATALRRRGDREARAWLFDEQDELVAIAHGDDPEHALGAALALAPLWERTGRCTELCDVLDAALARGATPDREGALSLAIARAQAWGLRGRLADARGVLEAALDADATHHGDAPPSDLVAEALTHLMVRHRQLGDVEGAIAAGERAFEILDEALAPNVAAGNAACLGLTFAEIGRTADARRFDERARDTFRMLGDRWGEGLVLGNLAQLAQGEGDLETAVYFADEAIDAFRTSRDPLYEGVYRGVRAAIAREAGSLDEARTGYDAAVGLLAAGGARHVEGIFRAQRAGLLAALGALDDARVELDAAGPLLRAAGAPAYLVLYELHAREVDLFRALAGAEAQRVALAESAAREAIDAASALPMARRSQFVAFAARLVARAVAPPLEPGRRVVIVGADAAWFQVLPGDAVPLVRRVAPRRILVALAAERRRAEPAALGVDALFAAGWPGERAIASARANRVRVAVATLRGLGLEGLVVTRDAGYLLAPDLELRDDPRAAP
jgi:predicted ATPase